MASSNLAHFLNKDDNKDSNLALPPKNVKFSLLRESSEWEDSRKLKIILSESHELPKTFEPDEKIRHCGMDCYDSTWAEPKFCLCLPFEMGIRMLIIFLFFDYLCHIFFIVNRWDCSCDI